MTDAIMLTKNTDQLRQQVAAHVAADSIAQGIYWDESNKRGCFIGCLAHSDDPGINEQTYGLPVMVQRIAESIFESLPDDEAKAFFAALPDAVGCDGKDLSKVGWQFLAAELRALPEQPDEVQVVIDPVIAGIDLLASGQEWAAADAADAADAAWAAADAADASDAAADAADAARAAADAADASDAAAAADAADASDAAARAARAAAWAAAADDAVWAATDAAADAAARAAAWAADSADAARRRQRDTLLALISQAPVPGVPMNDLDDMLTAIAAVAILLIMFVGAWWWLPQKWQACQKLYDNRPAQVFCLGAK